MIGRGVKEKNPTNTQQSVLLTSQGDFFFLPNNPLVIQDQHQSPFSVYQGKTCMLILPGKPRHLFMTWKIKFKMIIQIIDSLRGSMDLIIFLKQNIKINKDTHKDNCLYFLKLVGRTGTALSPFANPGYLNWYPSCFSLLALQQRQSKSN